MENIDLIEIRKKLTSLPVLQEKIQILQDKIQEAKANVSKLQDQYKAESLDVEKLERDSLRVISIAEIQRY